MSPLEDQFAVQNRPRFANRAFSDFAHAALSAPPPLWVLVDAGLAVMCVRYAHFLSPAFDAPHARYDPAVFGATYALVLVISAYIVGLYSRETLAMPSRVLLTSVAANGFAVLITTTIYWLLLYVQIGRYVLLIAFALSSITTAASRFMARLLAGTRKLKVAFVGRAFRFSYLAEAMALNYAGLFDEPMYFEYGAESKDLRVTETLRFCLTHDVDEIVIEDDPDLIIALMSRSAEIVRRGGVIRSLSAFHEQLLREVPIDPAFCTNLLGSGSPVGRRPTELLKRAFDISLAVAGLILGSPVFVAIAIILRFSGRGSVIYRQTRVGRFGTIFEMYKFRTMSLDAEKDGPRWAATNDARITRIGRYLRKSRLDELPQLWNILIGDMSFVGPRPERPEFVNDLEAEIPFYGLRHLVPPGLTGWAQIQFGYGAGAEEARRKLAFDLYYIRHYSLWFDLAICMRTAWSITRGAR